MTNPITSGTSTPSSKQWLGTYLGTVVNANDPTKQQRVQLNVPQVLGNTISNWAINTQSGTPAPAIGTQVLVTFLGGNINIPYFSEGITSNVVNNIVNASTSYVNDNPFFIGGSLTGWAAVNPEDTIQSTQPNPSTDPPYQYACLLVINNPAGTGGQIQEINSPFIVTAGNSYSVSAWVYYPAGGNVQIGIAYNAIGQSQSSTALVPAGVWTQIESTSDAPAGATQGYPQVGPEQNSVGDLFSATAIGVTGQIDGQNIISGSIPADAAGFAATDIGGNTTTINSTGQAPQSPNDGDLWYDQSNSFSAGFQLYQWSATNATWEPFQWGTNSLSAGLITADLLAADSISAEKIIDQTLDSIIINASVINTGTINTSSISLPQYQGGLFYYTIGGTPGNLVTVPFTDSTTWTCPAGVTSVQVECYGGAGGGANGWSGAGGGAGAYSVSTVSVSAGTVYTITIGTGGNGGAKGTTATSGSVGTTTSFKSGITVLASADGGTGGGSGGGGGTGASTGTGTISNGGNGANGVTSGSGYNTYVPTNYYPYSGSSAEGIGENRYMSYVNHPIQGGDGDHTSNGNTYTYIQFNIAAINAAMAGKNITEVDLHIHNLHSWYDSGMHIDVGYDIVRSTFPRSGPISPDFTNMGISRYSINENSTTTHVIDSNGSTFGNAFQNNNPCTLTLGPAPSDNRLQDYGYFEFDTMNLQIHWTETNYAGSGGGGAGGSTGAGSNGAGAANGPGQGGTGGGGIAGGGGIGGAQNEPGSAGSTPSGAGGGGGFVINEAVWQATSPTQFSAVSTPNVTPTIGHTYSFAFWMWASTNTSATMLAQLTYNNGSAGHAFGNNVTITTTPQLCGVSGTVPSGQGITNMSAQASINEATPGVTVYVAPASPALTGFSGTDINTLVADTSYTGDSTWTNVGTLKWDYIGQAGGAGARGEVVLTYNAPGMASNTLSGSIAGTAGTDSLSGANYPAGIYGHQLTLQNQSVAPSSTTLGPLLYGASGGNPKYVSDLDTMTYDFGHITQVTQSPQLISVDTSGTAVNITGLGFSNLAATTNYRIKGMIICSPTNVNNGFLNLQWSTTTSFTNFAIVFSEVGYTAGGSSPTVFNTADGIFMNGRANIMVGSTFGTGDRVVFIEGTVTTANANTLIPQAFASGSVNTFSVQTGSYLELVVGET